MIGVGMGLFFFIWALLMVVGIAGLVIGIVTIVDVAQTPVEQFGPWWDNTKQQWLVGTAVAFVVPVGTFIAGIHWYRAGRAGLRATGVAGRPFWGGAPRPAPYIPPPPPPRG